MREINVLTVEIRQGPAEIGIAEDDVEMVVIGQLAQIIFFPELYVVRRLRSRKFHEPRSRRHIGSACFFRHGGHGRSGHLLMDDEDVLTGKEVVVEIDDGVEAEVMELIRRTKSLFQILSRFQAAGDTTRLREALPALR